MALDQETINAQRELLTTHRRTLARLVRQAAIFGILTPSYLEHRISETRAKIAQLKVTLRTAGVDVDNLPADIAGTAPIEQPVRQLRFLSSFFIVAALATAVLSVSDGVLVLRAGLERILLPLFQPEQAGETLLVVLPFYYTQGGVQTEAHSEIVRGIREAAQEAGLTNLRVELAATALRSDDYDGAEQIGARYNASLVVWGDDTGVRVSVNFLNRRSTPNTPAQVVTINETARTQIADPPSYIRFITDDLPRQVSFLALFAVGQSLYINKDYGKATQVIEQAVKGISPGMAIGGLADAYFRLGWLYSAQGDLKRALADYDQAIVLDPKNASTYYNRGLAYQQQGDRTHAIVDFEQVLHLTNDAEIRRAAEEKLRELRN